MPSAKVTKILLSKSDFSVDEITKMTDGEAWAWVYRNKKTTAKDLRPQICFTGFRPKERENLWAIATANNLKIVKSVTQKLSFLCIGEAPGPSKLKKSKNQNVAELDEQQFYKMLETGEIPS